jgi:hypothetical protein
MSEEESFLERWSRRKHEAAAEAAAPPEPAESPAEAAPPVESAAEPLPPLESIGPGSDIAAFLKPGVPTALSRAALRRAWSADPAIRNFIGLSENSWDFTAEGGVPGFGAIEPDEVARLLDRLIGTPEEDANPETAVAAGEPQPRDAPETAPPEAAEGADDGPPVPAPTYNVNAALRDERPQGEQGAAGRRRHGGAVPE